MIPRSISTHKYYKKVDDAYGLNNYPMESSIMRSSPLAKRSPNSTQHNVINIKRINKILPSPVEPSVGGTSIMDHWMTARDKLIRRKNMEIRQIAAANQKFVNQIKFLNDELNHMLTRVKIHPKTDIPNTDHHLLIEARRDNELASLNKLSEIYYKEKFSLLSRLEYKTGKDKLVSLDKKVQISERKTQKLEEKYRCLQRNIHFQEAVLAKEKRKMKLEEERRKVHGASSEEKRLIGLINIEIGRKYKLVKECKRIKEGEKNRACFLNEIKEKVKCAQSIWDEKEKKAERRQRREEEEHKVVETRELLPVVDLRSKRLENMELKNKTRTEMGYKTSQVLHYSTKVDDLEHMYFWAQKEKSMYQTEIKRMERAITPKPPLPTYDSAHMRASSSVQHQRTISQNTMFRKQLDNRTLIERLYPAHDVRKRRGIIPLNRDFGARSSSVIVNSIRNIMMEKRLAIKKKPLLTNLFPNASHMQSPIAQSTSFFITE